MNKSKPSSVLILDIRNFTNNLIHFTKHKDDSFIKFIESIWQTGIDITEIVNEERNFHINSTGDGFILINFEKGHEKKTYLIGIILYHIINMKCVNFSKTHNCSVSFGMGIETGDVQEISVTSTNNKNYTYLGNVINKAARIESTTKDHSRANLIIGNNLNSNLVSQLFRLDYDLMMDKVKDNSQEKNEVVPIINKMNEINQKMLLSYIFEHNLKGVDKPVPLFRLSPTLANTNNPEFYNFIGLLCNTDTVQKIKNILEKK